MKKKLFISYTTEDSYKVKLIIKELAKNPHFEPLIVANNREPNKTLADKVADGILAAYCVITILTKDSINSQWVNQEIGYSHAKGIKVIPILDENIMDSLKGFIHKQKDLSYRFKTSKGLTKRDENKSFMSFFRLLINDLEDELFPLTKNLEMKLTPADTTSIDPVSNASKKLVHNLLNSKTPLGQWVKTGEICPETGVWLSSKVPYRRIVLLEGMTMPPYKSYKIRWKLIEYQ